MFNDELNEKKITDFITNTVVHIDLTVEQLASIYASVMCCSERFYKIGNVVKADKLKEIATELMFKSKIATGDNDE